MQKKLIIFLIFICGITSAQEPIRFTTKQGLTSNHVYDIQEDKDGFMWFATNRGLVKFDGETFRAFTIKDGLPNNDTWLLELDYQDRLWYFSKSNFQGYIKNDSIYKFPVEDNRVISPRFIHKSNKQIWLHSNGSYYNLFKDTLKISRTYKFKNWSKSLKEISNTEKQYNFNVNDDVIFYNPENEESLVIKKNQILFFDADFKLIEKVTIPILSNFKNQKIDNLGLLFNQIFYYALDNGLLFVDLKTRTSKFYNFNELIGVKSAKYIRCKALKNEIQISIPGHLLTFNYKLEFKKSYSFYENIGRISYKDSKGNIWLGDFTKGISLIPNSQVEANYFLKNKKVQKINKIDNVLYAGVNNDAFYRLRNPNNSFEKIITLKKTNGEIYQINKDNSDRTYFISTANSYVKNNNSINDLLINNQNLNIFNLTSFKSNTLFNNYNYSISGGYVLKSDFNFNYVTSFSVREGLLTSTAFKNNLFFGGSDGMHVVKNDTLVRPEIKHEILKISVTSFLSIKKNLFVGTDGRGVYLYDENKITHLKNTDGYSIQRIIKNKDNLWLSTNNGVHKVALDSKNLENSKIINSFYEADGLLQNNTNDIYLEKDTLLAASDIGISKINITNKLYNQKPKVYFKTKNDTLSFAKEDRKSIHINFGTQDYNNQDNISYQYRLLPNQKEWLTTQTKSLNFSNLSPNLYKLEVKATDQHFNSAIVKQYINVIPTWWQTTIAKFSFVLLSILGFLSFAKILQVRIRKKEKAKVLLDKKIAGLELQALRSQMNPHFVHNSLNAIQYYIQRNEVDLSENYLAKFSKLVRLFFEYSRRKTVTIAEEMSLLENYLHIEKMRFEDKLSFNINVDKRIEKEDVEIPSMLLQPIVENAVNHGLFHKIENGSINIEVKYLDSNAFKVFITDDGIGVQKAKEIYKNSAKNYRSNSSEVLQERLLLLKQSGDWDIEYNIKDLSDNSLNCGTEVSIMFKYLFS